MLVKEWLLIVHLGTTTNFSVVGSYPTWASCDLARTSAVVVQARSDLVWTCTQNLGEGRSLYPPRPGSQGLVK